MVSCRLCPEMGQEGEKENGRSKLLWKMEEGDCESKEREKVREQ